MPAPDPIPLEPVVIATLRAAGCIYAEDEARLLIEAARTQAELEDLVARRVQGLPLEQVLGWAEFCGLRIVVEPGVFVPRRRTELMVREAAHLARAAVAAGPDDARPGVAPPPLVVVDLCCGSGAVGVAVAAALLEPVPAAARATLTRREHHARLATPRPVELYAADVDPAAVACARRNVARVGGEVFEGDLYEPLPTSLRGRVELLVVNAPYVPTDEIRYMPGEARLYEPQIALDGGADGLDLQRRVIEGAPQWLAPGGHLLIETSERQAPHTAAAFAAAGLAPRIRSSDELDATVVVGGLLA